MPGAAASFIDALPGRDTFAYVNAFTFYNGDADVSRQLPVGGLLAANMDATVYADTSVFLRQTRKKLFGGLYAAAVAVPYVWMTVDASVSVGSGTVQRSSSVNGIGDIEIMPLMLGWTKGDVNYGGWLGIYAPTGDYEEGRLANVGKNYWTFEPTFYVSQIDTKTGMEFSAFAGLDFNTKNGATDYRSGDAFHIDVTMAQHVPKYDGLFGFGANVFYCKQITGDSGSGARLGDFGGNTFGFGPVLSYATKTGRKKTTDLVAELKWLPELDATRRLKGDTIWFKVGLAF